MQENEAATDKRKELEDLITVNSCLIDVLKDACEFNMELEYISLIQSALSVISKKQLESLKLVSELQNYQRLYRLRKVILLYN